MACLNEGAYQLKIRGKSHVFLLNTFFLLLVFYYLPADAQPVYTLKILYRLAGKMKNNKPSGKGWENLLISANNWEFEPGFWQLNDHLASWYHRKRKRTSLQLYKKII